MIALQLIAFSIKSNLFCLVLKQQILQGISL